MTNQEPDTSAPSSKIQEIAASLQSPPGLEEVDQIIGGLHREIEKWKAAFTALLAHAHDLENNVAALSAAQNELGTRLHDAERGLKLVKPEPDSK